MVPIILIGAGVIGLVGVVVNARRRDPALAQPLVPDTTDIDQENQS